MKQLENRNYNDSVRIVVHFTFMEKLKILFSNRIILDVDLNEDSDTGLVEKYERLRTR